MHTKLTLRIEKELIERMKIYVMSHNQTLSSLTKNIYKKILESEMSDEKELSPIAMKYKGIIKKQNLRERDEIAEYLSKKHG